jgi:hypothetical protein
MNENSKCNSKETFLVQNNSNCCGRRFAVYSHCCYSASGLLSHLIHKDRRKIGRCVCASDEHEGRTTIPARSGPYKATESERETFEAAHNLLQQGFTGTFDQLADYLARS